MVLSAYSRIELAPDFTMLGLRIAIVCIVVDMMILLKSLAGSNLVDDDVRHPDLVCHGAVQVDVVLARSHRGDVHRHPVVLQEELNQPTRRDNLPSI